VRRKGAQYEREDVIHALACYLGFTRVTDTSRAAIRSAINSAIRHRVLGYEWKCDLGGRLTARGLTYTNENHGT
jgi:hypothetical protein